MHNEHLIDWRYYTCGANGQIYSYYYKRYLNGNVHTSGYVNIKLRCIDGKRRPFRLHRVIWAFFNGTIPEGMQVNHIDENKQNNTLSNLNLMTCKENINWGTANERRIRNNRNNPLQSKPVVAVKDGEVVIEFPSLAEAKRNGFTDSAVILCCRNCYLRQGNNFFKGYQWYFKEEWLKIQATHDRVACGKLEI